MTITTKPNKGKCDPPGADARSEPPSIYFAIEYILWMHSIAKSLRWREAPMDPLWS